MPPSRLRMSNVTHWLRMPAGAKFATFIVVGALNCIYKMWGSMSSDNQSADQCVYFRKKKTLGLYALRVLRAYGMSHAALQAIFRSVAISKLLYASSAWIGFTKATDRQRVDGFPSFYFRSCGRLSWLNCQLSSAR